MAPALFQGACSAVPLEARREAGADAGWPRAPRNPRLLFCGSLSPDS